MPGIAWILKNPVITVFEDHVDEWIDIASDWIAKVVAKDLRLKPENIEGDLETIENEIKELADIAAGKISDMIPGPRNMAVAEGDLDFDEKNCLVIEISDFINELLIKLEHEALKKIYDMDWEEIEDEELFEGFIDEEEEKEEEDEFEMGKSVRTHLEDTLKNYIPSIFEEDIRDFVEGGSQLIVVSIKNDKVSDEEIPFIIKDKISDEIDKFVQEFGKLKSEYVNIIMGEYGTGIRTCRIIPVEEFINKIYKVTFERALGLLGKNPEVLSKDYFNEEF
jgi:hypothetical protein